MNAEQIIAASTAIAALLGVFVSVYGQRRQSQATRDANELAERAQGFSEMRDFAGALRERVDQLNKAVEHRDSRIDQLEKRIDEREAQIARLEQELARRPPSSN